MLIITEADQMRFGLMNVDRATRRPCPFQCATGNPVVGERIALAHLLYGSPRAWGEATIKAVEADGVIIDQVKLYGRGW